MGVKKTIFIALMFIKVKQDMIIKKFHCFMPFNDKQ